jgi:GNAT superfamily N-acetyltransferase
VSDLSRSTAFYRDLLGLQVRGGFANHDGYDGNFFALPGGGELELTTGPVRATGGTEEDLLVLYLRTPVEVRGTADRLVAAGVPALPNANPYWNQHGATVLDPDGYRIVIAVRDEDRSRIEIDWHHGARSELRPLFELAEDSRAQLDQYLGLGRVLVAHRGADLVGHLQVVPTTRAGELELKNMAVVPEQQGTGVGRALVRAALARCGAEGGSTMLVASAAADIGNLRFYQRLGFRLLSVERDAFTPATGYPPSVIDGIPLLDRVWLSQDLPAK